MKLQYQVVTCICCGVSVNSPDLQGSPDLSLVVLFPGWLIVNRMEIEGGLKEKEFWVCPAYECLRGMGIKIEEALISGKNTSRQRIIQYVCKEPQCKAIAYIDQLSPRYGGSPFLNWQHITQVGGEEIDLCPDHALV